MSGSVSGQASEISGSTDIKEPKPIQRKGKQEKSDLVRDLTPAACALPVPATTSKALVKSHSSTHAGYIAVARTEYGGTTAKVNMKLWSPYVRKNTSFITPTVPVSPRRRCATITYIILIAVIIFLFALFVFFSVQGQLTFSMSGGIYTYLALACVCSCVGCSLAVVVVCLFCIKPTCCGFKPTDVGVWEDDEGRLMEKASTGTMVARVHTDFASEANINRTISSLQREEPEDDGTPVGNCNFPLPRDKKQQQPKQEEAGSLTVDNLPVG